MKQQEDAKTCFDSCPVCDGRGFIPILDNSTCSFCNGTGEYTKVGASFMKGHSCQCVALDREKCALCGQRCHHTTNNGIVILARR